MGCKRTVDREARRRRFGCACGGGLGPGRFHGVVLPPREPFMLRAATPAEASSTCARGGPLTLLVVLAATAGLSACGGEERSPADTRPNIVFILLDDVRADDLYDHPFVDLPNIERLAAQLLHGRAPVLAEPGGLSHRSIRAQQRHPRQRRTRRREPRDPYVSGVVERGRVPVGVRGQVAHGT